MKQVKVNLTGDGYRILIGKSSFDDLLTQVEKLKLHKNIVVVTDANVRKYHSAKILNVFENYLGKILYYTLKPGEASKSYTELNRIYSFLMKNKLGRDTLIIAIGGGVTGDLVGYAASTYMRGVQLIHIPTTILAAVDSSIGGKTGINFEKTKNIIGSFYQPKLVLIDTEFMSTLPKAEKSSGIGEIIKYGYLGDQKFFNFITKNLEKLYTDNEEVLEETIRKSAEIKASVVSQDEKESGIRKILNLGHTFAHSFESELNFKVKHGEAVTAGIICALYLSNIIGILSDDNLTALLKLPTRLKLSSKFMNLNKENLYKIMLRDKKNKGGKIKFVLLSNIGQLLLDVEADKNDVFKAIELAEKTFH